MTDPIRDWFERHDETDSDYYLARRESPFNVVLPDPACDLVVYTPKQHVLLQLYYECAPTPLFGAVTKIGLPSEDDVAWLGRAFASQRFAFLGDCDPDHLLTYAYLAERLPMQWIGVSDRLLQACRTPRDDGITITLREEEVAGLSLVRASVGDLVDLVGPWCAGLLESGSKVEAEVLLSLAQCSRSELATTIADW